MSNGAGATFGATAGVGYHGERAAFERSERLLANSEADERRIVQPEVSASIRLTASRASGISWISVWMPSAERR
jgi:hypothetical protein